MKLLQMDYFEYFQVHGCNPSPPSVPTQSSARTLTAFPAYIITINMHFTSLSFPSSCKEDLLLFWSNFSAVSLVVPHQHPWFLTCAPHPIPVGEKISSSSKLTHFTAEPAWRDCKDTSLVSCSVHLPDMMEEMGRKCQPYAWQQFFLFPPWHVSVEHQDLTLHFLVQPFLHKHLSQIWSQQQIESQTYWIF